ncbi:MAG: DUF6503 family protein [Bacteroidota bacterium]
MTGCQSLSPEEIIQRAINAHGGPLFERSNVEFDFRGRHYRALHAEGIFEYERSFQDTAGLYTDILTNEKYMRTLDGEEIAVPDSMAGRYASSVNSVIYFALLPFKLNDPAVRKAYQGTSVIKGTPYHKIRISFSEIGGGEDFEDVFYYWIHPETWTMDYLAYEYQTDGGGIRFREAYNVRTIEGLRFADFVNYKADQGQFTLEKVDRAFDLGKLEELSRIELSNISVVLTGG